MFRAVSIAGICLLVAASFAAADIIYLKNGNILEVGSTEIQGDYVIFTIFNGRMSIDLQAVERIEKTATPPSSARLAGGVGGPVSGAATVARRTSGDMPSDAGSAESREDNEQLIQFYIAQKIQLEREIYFYRQQIDTLNSVIYAKANIFSDTTPERKKIRDMEEQIRQGEAKIRQIYEDARVQGLLPGEIRRIEDAKFKPPIETETRQTQPDFDSAEPIYDNSSEDKLYEEEEGEQGEVPPPVR